MGGVQQRVDHMARDRDDPVPIARAILRDLLADLDEALNALESGDERRSGELLADAVGSLQDELFPDLPDGRSVEEQDLAPAP